MADEDAEEPRELTDAEILAAMSSHERFLYEVALGSPLEFAAYAANWTPHQMRLEMRDHDYAQLVTAAKTRRIDMVERKAFDLAMGGDGNMVKFLLLNLRPDEFKDVRHIEQRSEHKVEVSVVHAAKQALMGSMRELGAAAFQPGGALDVIDVESTELEVDRERGD